MTRSKSSRSNQSKNHSSIFFLTLFSFLLLTFFLVFPFHEGHCAQVTLAWDPDNVSGLAGYKIYYGTTSGNYQANIDAGNVTTYTLSNLTIGTTYYAAATAYITNGLESTYSNEVMFTVPSCTYSISPASASFAASGGTGAVSITTLPYCNWTTSASFPWITVNTGSGLGSGTMSYTVSPNTGSTSQTASLTIAGKVFTVTEAGQTTYTITASAGTGGTISPSGQVAVQSGAGRAFTITPNPGYKIASVTVDGVSKGTVTSYTFSNVQANHTINATFSATTYTLSVSKNGSGGGTVSNNPTGTVFPAGTVVTLTAAPDANSVFTGWSGACSGTATSFQVTMNSNLSATATFNAKTISINATAGSGGTISPSGQVSVVAGSGQAFTITPNSSYKIADVAVDGASQGPIASYTFSNTQANHALNASFTAVGNTIPGLVAAYSFEEGTGTTLADISGNGNTGTIKNATRTSAGKYGSALVFNGSSSLVTINDSASLHLTTGMTLEAWVNPTVTPSYWRAIVDKDVDRYYLMASSDKNVPAVGGTFGAGNQNTYASSPLAVNRWTHLAATFDGAMVRLYVNGVQVASQAQTTQLTTSTNLLHIGADKYGEYFTGKIDEVRVYNRALTAAQIQADMNTPIGK